MFVVVIGSPFDGMQIEGPFPCHESANLYAERYRDVEWWIVGLEAVDIEAYQNSQRLVSDDPLERITQITPLK